MYQYRATFVRAIDGDTAVLDVDLGFNVWLKNIHFRFFGIDAPERGQLGWAEARSYVQKFFDLNKTVVINCYGQDKYGRWLADILDPVVGTSLNQQLVKSGLAVVYLP